MFGMGFRRAATVAALLAAIGSMPGAASAQDALIFAAGSSGSQNYRTGASLAKMVSDDTGMETVVQSYGGLDSLLPLIDAGEADFGQMILEEGRDAFEGKGIYEGRPLKNLRVVATLFPARPVLFVRADSDIKTLADVKGHTIPWGYNAQPGVQNNIEAMLAGAGLTIDDMRPVPVPTVGAAADSFVAGRVDVGFFAFGAGKLIEVDKAVGGIRYLPMPDGAEAQAAMQEVLPTSYITTVDPTDTNGLTEKTPFITLDYVMIAGAHVPDETVEKVTTALIDGLDEMAKGNRQFADVTRDGLAKKDGFTYHDGAIGAYKAENLWPAE